MKASLLIFLVAITFISCTEYQAVLKSESAQEKYVFADSLYQAGKYKKALKLMEQIVPSFRGKPQADKLMFMYANTFYELEDFYLSGYQFERFVTSYPQSDSAEVASYRSAKSYYELSPRFSLDQKETYTALEKLQEFVNKYPNSDYRSEANQLVAELREKLEKKDIETAEQYLRIAQTIGSFKPAISAYENFIVDHPGSIYRKNAFFGRFDAAYQLAINGIPALMEERLLTAKDYYQSFLKYYGETELREEADDIVEDINRRLENLQTTS